MAGAMGGSAVNIVKSGDAAPTGGTFTTNTFDSYLINDASQVAFLATTSLGATGIFVASAGVAAGEGRRDGRRRAWRRHLLGAHHTLTRRLHSGRRGGVLRERQRRRRWPVPGHHLWPHAGRRSERRCRTFRRQLRIQFLVARRAGKRHGRHPLPGAALGRQRRFGLFLKRAATGLVETVALQGQTAPGTTYPFATISTTINALPGEMTALDPSGEAWFNTMVGLGDRFVAAFSVPARRGAREGDHARGRGPGGVGGTVVYLRREWVPAGRMSSASGESSRTARTPMSFTSRRSPCRAT